MVYTYFFFCSSRLVLHSLHPLHCDFYVCFVSLSKVVNKSKVRRSGNGKLESRKHGIPLPPVYCTLFSALSSNSSFGVHWENIKLVKKSPTTWLFTLLFLQGNFGCAWPHACSLHSEILVFPFSGWIKSTLRCQLSLNGSHDFIVAVCNFFLVQDWSWLRHFSACCMDYRHTHYLIFARYTVVYTSYNIFFEPWKVML